MRMFELATLEISGALLPALQVSPSAPTGEGKKKLRALKSLINPWFLKARSSETDRSQNTSPATKIKRGITSSRELRNARFRGEAGPVAVLLTNLPCSQLCPWTHATGLLRNEIDKLQWSQLLFETS